jgi:nucleotide-binding universal stress UspA family protein
MLPIHTILHPTDFSEHSEHALQFASGLARDYGAQLMLVHVIVPPPVIYGEGLLTTDVFVNREVQERLHQWQIPDERVRVVRQCVEGDPATEIVRVARERAADLIVMGTHGRTGLSRLLMGSVAEQVVRQAPCPVLTVGGPTRTSEGQLVASTDEEHLQPSLATES